MLDNEEYSSCVNPKISSVLNKIGVGSFRSESYWDLNPENPCDGKGLILNGLFTLNSSGIINNVPLNPDQVTILMESMQDQHIVHLDLTNNKFDDNALVAVLNNLPSSVKELNLGDNNFTVCSLKVLEDFREDHPNCNIIIYDEHGYDAAGRDDNSEIPAIDQLDLTIESMALGDNQSTIFHSEFDPQA